MTTAERIVSEWPASAADMQRGAYSQDWSVRVYQDGSFHEVSWKGKPNEPDVIGEDSELIQAIIEQAVEDGSDFRDDETFDAETRIVLAEFRALQAQAAALEAVR